MTDDAVVAANAPVEKPSYSSAMASPLYIQYGCGACAPEGWLNFDASPRLRLERLAGFLLKQMIGLVFPRNAIPGNIVRGLPVPDGAAVAVFCSHVLEHLRREDVPAALRNTFRMLRPGGQFRLVVPDLQWRAARYILSAEAGDPGAADTFLESCLLGTRGARKGMMDWARYCFGNSVHQWMYDFSVMKMLLEEAGFIEVRRCELGDCGDPCFTLVEDPSRFFDGGEPELAIQAHRP
jgi:SAM-dependent methyltransferase